MDNERILVNDTKQVDVSIVMPCLNESKTIEKCIREAFHFYSKNNLIGEVIIVDNGSVDDSVVIAEGCNATVVHAAERGYGNACRIGFKVARGEFVFKMDADGTYVCDDIQKMLVKFNEGYDYVIGSRLKGKILPEAMPFSHQYIGNPIMSLFARFLCNTGVSDICCGLKGFRNDVLDQLVFQSPGMVFGPETTIVSRQSGLRIAEVPITYRPDMRESGTNLRRYRDGINNMMYIFAQSIIFKKYNND
tara:strand:+ start:11350 stop:12093 length:744 start_codon:yes stop_codon:yes gene_type:complete